MTRRVILVCGPPGAGKTTYARKTGLQVYDRDDPQWSTERLFARALVRLGQTPDAQAVVIRSGATRSSRARTVGIIGATSVTVLPTNVETCERRIRERNRMRPPLYQQIAAASEWWRKYEADTDVGPVSEAW